MDVLVEITLTAQTGSKTRNTKKIIKLYHESLSSVNKEGEGIMRAKSYLDSLQRGT